MNNMLGICLGVMSHNLNDSLAQ